ncbi:hypothetical protein ACQ4PT_030481 [Festuca glaucescens]
MPSLASCTVDICSGEVSAPEELSRLAAFLYQFASAKHLRLRSERLCPSIADIVGATSRILQHAPNLEVLSFVFETGTRTDADKDGPLPHGRYNCKEEELLDAHRLRYNRYDIIDAASGGARIPCLANRVREINLVHYQGGRAQRKLAKFLLCNASVMDELWCQFAEGPLWTQTELMREMKSWVTNGNANTVFR